jgi:predicted deacylase
MKSGNLQIGSVQVNVGEKKSFTQTLDLSGTQVELPIFVINGVNEGPRLVITGGIHGAEYASIEAALQIGRSLQPEALSGQVIILPVVNMPAYRARSIYVCPLDGINLNRVFPGQADGGKTAQLAHWVFQNAIKDADYYIDMHGGDLVEALMPFTIYADSGDAELDAKAQKLAEVFGIKDIVKSGSAGSTIAGAAGAGVPAILTESGGQGVWTKEDILLHTDGADRVMRWLKMIPGDEPALLPTRILNQFLWLSSEHTGYYYADVVIGQSVKKGQYLGKVTNFEGSVLQEVIAPDAGEVLFLVSSLSINEGDPLLSIGAA